MPNQRKLELPENQMGAVEFDSHRVSTSYPYSSGLGLTNSIKSEEEEDDSTMGGGVSSSSEGNFDLSSPETPSTMVWVSRGPYKPSASSVGVEENGKISKVVSKPHFTFAKVEPEGLWYDDVASWKDCDNIFNCVNKFAAESISLACKWGYEGVEPGETLLYSSFNSRMPVVMKRIAQGGVQLSMILNRVFGHSRGDGVAAT
ncbi:hypothetical protein RJ639_034626 [Escallonia herrerae]|uniref:Aspergillus nuclease S1 n=1 Tax=Escallonia herrerae TaxID=1293975 RepID=A0AA88XCJ2_9ASTE|nr:hypothetical protein RJ639_034626 [Escallonia herrerae]